MAEAIFINLAFMKTLFICLLWTFWTFPICQFYRFGSEKSLENRRNTYFLTFMKINV